MALNSCLVSIIISSFLLLDFGGEAHVQDPPVPHDGGQDVKPTIKESPLKPLSPKPSTVDPHEWLNVPADEQARLRLYLKANMVATATKTKEFLTGVILKRLNDPSMQKSTKQCLTKCNEAYQAAIVAMQKGINDISHDNYYQTSADIHEFSSDIETCTNCFGEMIVENTEFKHFQEWAKGITGECTDRLQKYVD